MKKGENEIVVAAGANETLSETDIRAAENARTTAEILLLQLEIPVASVLFAAKSAHTVSTKVILNPTPAQTLPNEIFSYLYLITPNETEASILTGIKVIDLVSAAAAATILLEAGVQNVIITMGAQGAFFKNHATEIMVRSAVVKAVDTTAAGDTFNGVLATEIMLGKEWKAAIATACKEAAIAVTRMGAQASMPYRTELEAHN